MSENRKEQWILAIDNICLVTKGLYAPTIVHVHAGLGMSFFQFWWEFNWIPLIGGFNLVVCPTHRFDVTLNVLS